MDIERFDPATDAAAVRACHDIHVAAVQADGQRRPPMSLTMFRAWMALGWTEDTPQAWLATSGAGTVRGFYVLVLPARENRHTAYVSPVVHPAHRRAGLGTALVAHAADRARLAGRTLLTGATDELPADAPSAGLAFARTLGARHRLTGVWRVQRLDSVPAGHLATLRARAEAKATGYSLLTWDGPTPNRWLDAVTEVYDAEGDAPMAPGEEPPHWDAARVRADEARSAAQGLRFYTVAAQPDSGAGPVAITQLGVDPEIPHWGIQELTAVIRPHRGHRLGLLVKVAMLDLLAKREPQLTHILTHNADGNEHMVAINTGLGFEVLELNFDWELAADRAPALTGPATAGSAAAGSASRGSAASGSAASGQGRG